MIMKTHAKIFFIPLLILVLNSCNNESINTPTSQEPNNSQALVSITYNSTWANYLEVINFFDGKITDIQFSDGSFHLYSYTNDLVTQIKEYDNSGTILFTNTFSYDADGKLSEKMVLPNILATEWENYVIYEYSYTADAILSTIKQFNFEDIQQGESSYQNLVLNQNTITRSMGQIPPPYSPLDFRGDVTYLDDNPITYQKYFSGNLNVNSSYEYIDVMAADAYTIEKLKFGLHWKINSLLSYGTPALGTYVLDDITSKYLSKIVYDYNYQEQSFIDVTTYSYEFDENNLLLSQTQTKESGLTGEDYVTVITYEYE